MRTAGGIVLTAAALLLCGTPLLAALGEASAGQDAAQPMPQTGTRQAPAFRSGVELVMLDVGVVDRDGRPVSGLGAGDFTVTVAGQPRRVVTAEFVDATASTATPSDPDVVPVSTNEGGGVGRLFVFVVDQNTLEPGSARQVGMAASRFLNGLTFADRSAVMMMPLGPNVGFTWAHDRVREALGRLTGRNTLMLWELGSLSEARDIANRNQLALRTVGARECSAGGGSGISAGPISQPPGGAPGGGGGGQGPPPTGGGTPPGGGGTGSPPAGGGGQPGGAAPPSGGGGMGAAGAFGAERCLRELQVQAESTWRSAQMTSLASLMALRQVLSTLERVRGDKTVVLISGGWPLDDHEQTSLIASVAAEAANARATLFTVFVPGSTFSASRRSMSSSPTMDHFIHSRPLETLSAMTGGGTFRAEVNHEAIFERLGRELGGYYRLGVEKESADLDGKGRRMKVQVSRSGATVRAREIFDIRTYEDRDWSARLASALDAPIPATGIGLRVTSYVTADPDNRSQHRLVLTGEASRLQRGEATFQVAVRDLDGKRVLAGEQPLREATDEGLRFSAMLPLAPGTYIVRVAVIDSAGQVGSVDHRAEVRAVPLGKISATGPLLVRVPTQPGAEARFALDSVRQDERLALEVALAGDTDQLDGTDVAFEIAATADGPALVQTAAALSSGSRSGGMVAQAVADVRVLPPGHYVARAKVTSGSEPLGEVRRAFEVIAAPRIAAGAVNASGHVAGRTAPASPNVSAYAMVPPFAVDQVLARPILGTFLDRVAARPDAAVPGTRELLDRARTAELAELTVSDAQASETAVAAFLRGVTLLAQNKLDPAANAFRSAMRASPDFYPAMVYLGACYAAGGKDKEAAGAWRTALIKEGDAVALHLLLADAFLRLGRGDMALQTVEAARARWPEDEELKRRFVTAALLAGQHGDGLKALEELMPLRTEDESLLVLAIQVMYEALTNGSPVESVEQDRARMMRFAETYRARGGASLALVETWVAAANAR